ncbi:MAG TPA: hypothetical protein VHO25_09565 [Polyangiaceae bacterium]|nr:hypothetical protein [Polyangiaceae bacterium]
MGAAIDLIRSTGVEIYIVGGTVRDHFLNVQPSDLDIIVPNDDTVVSSLLDERYPSRTNRHGNKRYWVDGRNIDVIRPKFFYKPFTCAEDAIGYFDVSINAMGVRLADGLLIDTGGGMDDIAARRIRITRQRWQEANDFEFVHLMLRTLRYTQKYHLRFFDHDVIASGIHRLQLVNWDEVWRFHSLTREQATEQLSQLANAPT